jgi:superfamily II RNA helicase
VLSEEYTNRIRVLKSIDYIDKNGIIGLKGKVACVISHMEVLITELLFENKFDGKSCAELAAMLSPMTCQFTYAGSKDRDRNMEYKHAINYLVIPIEMKFYVF